MKCTKCGQDKLPYHFFSFRGRYNKEFFANPLTSNTQCFDCNGPYKCIYCGVVQDANQFRIQGRACNSCKTVGIHNIAPVADALDSTLIGEFAFGAENSAENEDLP